MLPKAEVVSPPMAAAWVAPTFLFLLFCFVLVCCVTLTPHERPVCLGLPQYGWLRATVCVYVLSWAAVVQWCVVEAGLSIGSSQS